MPASYPRTSNPYLCLSHSKRRSYQHACACLCDISKSIGGRLILQAWLHLLPDEAGWHKSSPRSARGQDHLAIKNAKLIIDKNGKRKRETRGHILPDGSTEEWGPYPSLQWLTKEGKVPGMDAIKTLEDMRKAGHRKLIKDVRRQLRERLSQNGVSSEY